MSVVPGAGLEPARITRQILSLSVYTQKWNFLPAILRLSLENGSFLWYIV